MSLFVGLLLSGALGSTLTMVPSTTPSKVGWSGRFEDVTPVYIASGLFGVRVPYNALARPGSCRNCSNTMFNFVRPTTSALVGGYVYTEFPGAVDEQNNLQIGASPAPFPFETEVLVTTPEGTQASFQASVQGPNMDVDPSVVIPLSQFLDFATGELTTTVRFGARNGSWSVTLEVLQFISQTVPSLALQNLTVSSRHPATLSVTLLPRISSYGLPGTPYNDTTPSGIFNEGRPNMLLAMRSNSGSKVAMCAATLCSGLDREETESQHAPEPLLATPCKSSSAASTMISFIGVVGDTSHPVPAAGALRSVHYGLYRTFEKLRLENARAWADRWESRVVVKGPSVRNEDQTAIDAAMFYLLSSAHTSSRNGLSIDVYSCLEYGGRMFWDADLWMVPALALLSAPAAGAVTDFRGRTLDMAKRNAGLYGFRGAQFPWETATSDGHDACVSRQDWSEQHISLDVALGVLATARALGSTDFNLQTGYPVLSNVVAWLLSRGEWTARGFEILHMGGPDESLGQVSNNNFFNIAGMMVLGGAIELASTLPAGYVDSRNVAEWRRTLHGMVLAKSGDVIKPFDEAPNNLSAATPKNWSLGSLAFLFALGLPEIGALSAVEINASLAAEEVMRKRFRATAAVPCSSMTEWFICGPYAAITAYMGDRAQSLSIQQSYATHFHLPPFYITTEFAADRRSYGHYGTNWGATLQAIMLGMSGLRLGALGTDPSSWIGNRTVALPDGWNSISFGAWLGGGRYNVTAVHGAFAEITPMTSAVGAASVETFV